MKITRKRSISGVCFDKTRREIYANDIKNMKWNSITRHEKHGKYKTGGMARQIAALTLAAGALWTVYITSGHENAFPVIKESIDLTRYLTRLDSAVTAFSGDNNGLSPAAAVILRQSPALYAAKLDASDGKEIEWDSNGVDGAETETNAVENADQPDSERQAGKEIENNIESHPGENLTESADEHQENQENQNADKLDLIPMPETPIQPVEYVDNGVRAKTLIPTGSSGYTVIENVYISSTRKDDLNISALREPFDTELTADGPQILILHSHGSEAYTPVAGTEVVWSGDSRTTDFRYSVVKAGDEMAAIFADAGISVIHDRTLYDYPNYTGSYDRSLAAIQSYMAQYPTIKFILDVHRDYISDSKGNPYKVVSEIEGLGTAAQMTLVMGSDGSGAAHPNWMENLKLAVAIQEQILSDYPTLMRPVLLRKSRYNQHATTGSLLIEVGTAGNAPEEAFLSAKLFALEMTKVLISRSK